MPNQNNQNQLRSHMHESGKPSFNISNITINIKKMYKKKTFDFSSLLGGSLSGGFCLAPKTF
jgi:hypothetical protein